MGTKLEIIVVLLFILSVTAESHCSLSVSTKPLLEGRAERFQRLVGLRGGSYAVENDIFLPPAAKKVEVNPILEHTLEHGHMSLTTAVVNMVADLCPHGMLPLAYGIGAGGGTSPLIGAIVLLVFGSISAYSLISIGRACQLTKQSTLAGAWTKAVGADSTWLINASISALCYGCLVFYCAFAGDIFAALAVAAKLPMFLQSRTNILISLLIAPMIPLCLLRDLSALQVTSFAGTFAIAYTAMFVIYRCLDRSYQVGGAFHLAMKESLRPNLPQGLSMFHYGPGTLIMVNVVCVAFICHYNGAGYYSELKKRTVRNFTKVTCLGMGISMLVFILMMKFGSATFGTAAQALLLNNYHKSADPLATIARAATGFSILCGYPLMFAGFKNAFFPLVSSLLSKDLGKKLAGSYNVQNAISIAVLTTVTTIACFCTEEDVGTVIGLIGSLLGSFCCYIMPAVLNIRVGQMTVDTKPALPVGELLFNRLMILFGLFVAVFGTYITLAESGSHGHH